MKIFSVALGPHDHNVYDGVFHNQIERYSRIKHNFDGTAIQSNSGSYQYTDSPSSTSALTYKAQLKARTNSVSINPTPSTASITLMEIAG